MPARSFERWVGADAAKEMHSVCNRSFATERRTTPQRSYTRLVTAVSTRRPPIFPLKPAYVAVLFMEFLKQHWRYRGSRQ